MYRQTLSLFVYMSAVATQPQHSNVTYVKIQPTVGDNVALDATVGEYDLETLPPTVATRDTTTDPSENNEFDREVTQEYVTTESDEAAGATAAPPTSGTRAPRVGSVTSAPRTYTYTRPSARFISKLSYFNKTTGSTGVSANLVEKPGNGNKRTYKSRCRCEKIWNCPKLQITVPRCPEEYFLCCF